MVFLKSMVMVFILSLGTSALADVAPAILQRAPGKVECDEVLMRCTYLVQNITSKELIARINANIFPGLAPSEGNISAEHIKKIVFYIKDEDLRSRIISLIPLLDIFEEIAPTSLVQLTTEIYSLSESAATEFQAQATSAGTNPADEIAKWVVSSMSGAGAAAMGGQIATNLLSSILGSKKIKEESTKIAIVTQPVSNLSSINYSQNMTIYVAPAGAGVAKEQNSGLSINGVVSIQASNSDEIYIKDYSIKYGVIDPTSTEPNQRVNVLSISNPQLLLYKGVSTTLVSTLTTEERVRREYSFLSFGKNKSKLQNQILIVMKAEAISYDALIASLKKVRSLQMYTNFSEEAKTKFPQGDVFLQEVLSHVKPYSYFTPSGSRMLGFQLDKKDARLSNITKSIQVTAKSTTSSGFGSGNLNQKKTLTVQNLMLTGFRFDDLKGKDLEQSVLKIKLEFKVFLQDIIVSKEIYYNPETNLFIEE